MTNPFSRTRSRARWPSSGTGPSQHLEVLVDAIGQVREPTGPGLHDPDLQPREAVEHTGHEHADECCHLFERVAHDMTGNVVRRSIVAHLVVDRDRAFVDDERHLELLRCRPQHVTCGVRDQPRIGPSRRQRVGPDQSGHETGLHRLAQDPRAPVRVVKGKKRHGVEAGWIGAAVVGGKTIDGVHERRLGVDVGDRRAESARGSGRARRRPRRRGPCPPIARGDRSRPDGRRRIAGPSACARACPAASSHRRARAPRRSRPRTAVPPGPIGK